MENQIAKQREGRRPARRADADREISDEVGRARAGEVEAAASAGNGTALWSRAKSALNARRAAVHLANVNNEQMGRDADALFAYYNDTRTSKTAVPEVTFSWVNHEKRTGVSLLLVLRGARLVARRAQNPMCGVSCAIERRRAAHRAQRPHSHARGDAQVQAHEHDQRGHAAQHDSRLSVPHRGGRGARALYEHGPHFRAMMRRINNDTLTFDAFRPSGGYDMRFSDAGDVEFEDLLTQEMLDALTLEHFKISHFVSKYSQFAERVTDNERWVRFPAPARAHVRVHCRRCVRLRLRACIRDGVREAVYLNVTQEGRDHLDDLVEGDWFGAAHYHRG